ncbi:MAG: Ig-like domain-containing protein [Anaerovoracaceae bacterium]
MNKTSRNKKKGRILSIVLTVAMVLSMMPSLAFADTTETPTHENHNVCGLSCSHSPSHADGEYESLPENVGTISLNKDYYLEKDVTLTTNNITVAAGTTLNLCLNGNALESKVADSVITVEASGILNICDCKPKGGSHKFKDNGTGLYVLDPGGKIDIEGGVITGGNNSEGGGIYNSGTTNIYGGTIVGNTSNGEGGGIYNSGTTNIYGGSIIGNKADREGGGIYSDSSNFAVSNTTIKDNSAIVSGGGIYNNGTATIGDGTIITGNRADSYTGGIESRGPLNLHGKVEINSNTKPDKTTPSNLSLVGKYLKITGDLTNDTKIGVSGGDPNGVITNYIDSVSESKLKEYATKFMGENISTEKKYINVVGDSGVKQLGFSSENPIPPSGGIVTPDPIIEAPQVGDKDKTEISKPQVEADGKVDDKAISSVIDKIASDLNKDILELDLLAPKGISPEMPADIFKKIKETEGINALIIRTNVLTQEDLPVTMEFKKEDIKNTNIPVKTGGKKIATPKDVTEKLPEGTKTFAFDLAHQGAFPGIAKVTAYVPKDSYKAGDKVYLYHIDGSELIPVKGAPFSVGTENQVTFNLEHASQYVVTSKASGLTLSKNAVNITNGNSTVIKTNLSDVKFTSSDKTVAKVDSKGKVTGLKPGVTTITVTKGSETATCKVRVRPSAVKTLKIVKDKEMLNAEWTNTNGVTGYVLLKSTSKDGEYKVAKKITKGDMINLKFKNKDKTEMYYKIKAYKEIEGKNYYGQNSNIVKVSAK